MSRVNLTCIKEMLDEVVKRCKTQEEEIERLRQENEGLRRELDIARGNFNAVDGSSI
jgi:hypothetical protein